MARQSNTHRNTPYRPKIRVNKDILRILTKEIQKYALGHKASI